MMRLELTIDDLVLVGFDPRDRHRIADAIERELATHLVPARSPDDPARRSPRRLEDGSPAAVARSVRDAVGAAIAARSGR